MRIGELAERSGLSRDTIRFYERNGLVRSVPGSSATNNYRDYPEDNLVWLRFITGAREAGLSIADLRDITAAISCDMDRTEARQVLAAKIDELKARADEIRRAIDFLERARDQTAGSAEG
ncbi:MAG: MerR family transcriptional regulator [Alphaproteobacteria bacterium]|nr:MAG: MerR family transcriptional regulator [Alphaproteobacteria bacterium]